MADFTIVLSREDWMRMERKLGHLGAHGKVINILQMIITFAKDNPDLQLEVIRQRLSISRIAMKKYATLLGILNDAEEEVAVVMESSLDDILLPLIQGNKPIPLTRLARQYGVSTSLVIDRMKTLQLQVGATEVL
ncbi:MAG: hypothetical protein OWT28_08330 [Firmicutes bacterium]|nr:hypothetical protein [Bacillota bacterium]